MTKKPVNEKMILIAGLIGITAAILTIISDIILLGRPDAAFSFFVLGTESMADLAPWRITVGTFLGVFALPFQIAGIIPLYFGLKPAGNKMAGVVLGGAVYALFMGVAFHVSYAFMGSAWKMYHETGLGNTVISEMMARFETFWMIIIVSVFIVLLLVSVCCVLLVLTGKSLYPKWLALLNPLCVFVFMYPLVAFLPAPLGGYVSPTYLNLSSLILFILSLALAKKVDF